jgi:hypothetical protein
MVHSNQFIVRLAKGSLGGKGRGIAFICNFIENINFKKLIPKTEYYGFRQPRFWALWSLTSLWK